MKEPEIQIFKMPSTCGIRRFNDILFWKNKGGGMKYALQVKKYEEYIVYRLRIRPN